jgi:hypothetical protein
MLRVMQVGILFLMLGVGQAWSYGGYMGPRMTVLEAVQGYQDAMSEADQALAAGDFEAAKNFLASAKWHMVEANEMAQDFPDEARVARTVVSQNDPNASYANWNDLSRGMSTRYSAATVEYSTQYAASQTPPPPGTAAPPASASPPPPPATMPPAVAAPTASGNSTQGAVPDCDYACALTKWTEDVAAYSAALSQDPKDLETAQALADEWAALTSRSSVRNPYRSVVADQLPAEYETVEEFFSAVNSGLEEIQTAEGLRAEWLHDVHQTYEPLAADMVSLKARMEQAVADENWELLASLEAQYRAASQAIVRLADKWLDRIEEDPEAFNQYARPSTAESIAQEWHHAWVRHLHDTYGAIWPHMASPPQAEDLRQDIVGEWVDPYLRAPSEYEHFRSMVNEVWGDDLFADKLTHYADYGTTPWDTDPDWRPGENIGSASNAGGASNSAEEVPVEICGEIRNEECLPQDSHDELNGAFDTN